MPSDFFAAQKTERYRRAITRQKNAQNPVDDSPAKPVIRDQNEDRLAVEVKQIRSLAKVGFRLIFLRKEASMLLILSRETLCPIRLLRNFLLLCLR
jgi:hypothetical protein